MYVHDSLSVCGLVDNRSAVACVLRSLADLCSVLPLSSGLAASPSPNILYPNHTFWISSSVEDSIFRYFHYICSHSLLFPSLINSHHQMLAAGIVMFAYIPPHIFDLKTVVGRYESAGYQTNQDSVMASGSGHGHASHFVWCHRPQGQSSAEHSCNKETNTDLLWF